MLLDKVLDRKDKKLPYKVKGDYVKIDNLNSSLLAYIGTLEPEFQEMITVTSGNDGGHSDNSRHYKDKAVDIRFDPRLYKRVAQDPVRKQMGVTLVDPNHGDAKHIHFSVGEGSENNQDVWREGPKKDNRVKAYQILLNKGYDRNTALGIVGNLVQESGPSLDTEALGFDGTGSYGVAQWLGERKDKLKEIRPDDYNTIEGQLDFLDWELNNTHKSAYEKMKSEGTVEGVATAFSDHYEKPNKAFAYNDKRITYAQELGELIPEVKEYEPLGSTKDEIDFTSDFQETQMDNTSGYLNGKSNATYASMAAEKEEKKESATSANEEKLMALVEQYKAQAAQNTAAAYQKTQKPEELEEEQYGPQETQNMDHLYNYINIETYEDGGGYKVKKGDSLSKIAKANNTTLEQLIELNPRYQENPGQINIGDQVKLSSTPEPNNKKAVGPDPNYVAPQSSNFADSDYLYTGRVEVNEAIENARKKLQSSDQGYPNRGMASEYQTVVNSTIQSSSRLDSASKRAYNEVGLGAGYQEDNEERVSREIENKKSRLRELQPIQDKEQEDKTVIGKIDINNTSKSVKDIQSFLFNSGYNLDPNDAFKNGGIDGVMGEVTKKAIASYNSELEGKDDSINPYITNKDTLKSTGPEGLLGSCDEEQCSEYVQNEVVRNLNPKMSRKEWNETVGITGDAWDLGNNIINKGGQLVELNNIRKGDIVGINSGSGGRNAAAAKKALASRDKFYTHSGVIDEVNPDGTYYVLHNWHDVVDNKYVGKEYRTLVDPKNNRLSGNKFGGTGIVEAFRPNYEGIKPKKEVRDDISVNLSPELEKAGASKFIPTIQNKEFKSKIINSEGINEDEYYSLSKAAIGIMGQETTFGENPLYKYGPKKIVSSIAVEAGLKSDEASRGPGSMKLSTNFNSADIGKYGVDSKNIREPENAMKATMVKLTRDYKRLLKKGESKEDALYKAIQTYNSGNLKKVTGERVMSIPGSKEEGDMLPKEAIVGKTRADFAKEYDLDYVNKVINFGSKVNLNSSGAGLKTTFDELTTKKNVIKWEKYVNGQLR